MSCVQELKGEYLSPYPAKWFRKFEPSPIIDEVLYHVGVLKDDAVKRVTPKKAKADKHDVKVNKREVYALVAKSLLRPQIEEDPLTTFGASGSLSAINYTHLWGPRGTSNWASCADSQYETCSALLQSSLSALDYTLSMWSTAHGPYMFIHDSALSGTPLPTATTPKVYALPCPLSSPYTISTSLQMNGKVLLRAWLCQNTSSSLYYVRYSAQDSTTNSYTIAAAGMGILQNNGSPYWSFVYNLPSSSSKASTDIYYYIYEIDVQYS